MTPSEPDPDPSQVTPQDVRLLAAGVMSRGDGGEAVQRLVSVLGRSEVPGS